MSPLPDRPQLTRRFCFDEAHLRDFLRISRFAIDDTILQNLNARMTPAANPFDPRSTAERQTRPTGQSRLAPEACQEFKEKILFPSWQARTDVLNYCAGVTSSRDQDAPNDPSRETLALAAQERLVDERLDPYGARHLPIEGKDEVLSGFIRSQKAVENIIRARTWSLIGERCDNQGVDADGALDQWRGRNVVTKGRQS